MRLKGFIGPAYSLRSVNVECQRCVNLYPEINEIGTGEAAEIGSLVGTPGLRLLGTCGSGPIRGIYVASTGGMVIVSGSEVYRVNNGWTFTKLGDLVTNSGRVGMADNGTQLMIVDGAAGYIVSLVTATLTQIPSASFPGADTVGFMDGYFICNNPGTGQFFWSGLYDGLSWDALDFVTAEGSPDALVGVMVSQRQVWAMGARTVEVWWNSGGDPAFARIDGAFIEYGCIAPHTVAKLANSVAWVGAGPNANGVVWMSVGYQPKRISNHAIEQAIQSYGDISTATAWVYQENGHAFYCLNFPNATTTWVYDVATGQWHERSWLNPSGNFERHRAEVYAYGFGSHVVGDYQNGNIYALEQTTYTDNGLPKKWFRRSPHTSSEMKRLIYSKFQLDAQMGVGLDGSPTVGADPQVLLRYSDDFGNTWTPAGSRSLGKIGEYANRAIWRRLGSSRNRVFEVSGTDPVQITLLGAEVDVAQGVS